MSKKKRSKPREIPWPPKKPEILPEADPDNPVLPGKEPEIFPGTEPDNPSSTPEIPKPGKGL